jgi:dihydroorotase-like cyclic amidohydrolase
MSDFLSTLIAESAVVSRDVTFRGKTGPVYFRRISAGERAQLVRGQKVSSDGGKTSVEIDVGENVTSRHMLVQFSVCNDEAGNKRFKTLREVQALDGGLVEALYEHASEVNREEEAGKA